MFKNVFSFEGRIGRKEFRLTLVIFVILAVLLQAISAILIGIKVLNEGLVLPVLGLLLIPVLVFLLAQGAKRCHDIGLSGWYQLIPFFNIYLIFAKDRAQF